MITSGECRPVGGTHHLTLNRLATASPYIAPPPRPITVAQAVTLPPLVGAPKADIERLVRDSVHAEAPDWSGSTFSVWGGDPNDAIGAAGESLFNLQKRSGGGSGLVVPWGSHPPANLVAGPMDVRKNIRELKTSLRTRVNLGGNDLPAALRRVAERLPSLREGQALTVFIPTDGCEAVTRSTHDAVAGLPENSCHLILIDPLNWCSPAMEDDWRSVAFGSVTRIEDLSVRNLATELAGIYAASLGLALGTTPPPVHPARRTRKPRLIRTSRFNRKKESA
ncbi:hypothetical protein SAMN05892883_2801 [Jatrophihabitans sp. GAS493]|uniref:hypothetical protein n=1 Tax=Jatrophihabitans sp. GAS493 TaxID=1907575 RepID=UPI000BB71E49|nr:hypothetical protein [Jatrophihabitans sp. GAS493]SOD73507.1 hypothetical protein SAMN05892883_2801 [Jatrophihabitans sp. GAS493]